MHLDCSLWRGSRADGRKEWSGEVESGQSGKWAMEVGGVGSRRSRQWGVGKEGKGD